MISVSETVEWIDERLPLKIVAMPPSVLRVANFELTQMVLEVSKVTRAGELAGKAWAVYKIVRENKSTEYWVWDIQNGVIMEVTWMVNQAMEIVNTGSGRQS